MKVIVWFMLLFILIVSTLSASPDTVAYYYTFERLLVGIDLTDYNEGDVVHSGSFIVSVASGNADSIVYAAPIADSMASLSVNDYSSFDGWSSDSSAYSLTEIAERSEASGSFTTNLTDSGISLAESSLGDTLWFFVMTNHDADNTFSGDTTYYAYDMSISLDLIVYDSDSPLARQSTSDSIYNFQADTLNTKIDSLLDKFSDGLGVDSLLFDAANEDVSLYRGGADSLQTDDMIIANNRVFAESTLYANDGILYITNDDDDGDVFNELITSDYSYSVADDDLIFRLLSYARNDADELFPYSGLYARSIDVSDGSENSSFSIRTVNNGTPWYFSVVGDSIRFGGSGSGSSDMGDVNLYRSASNTLNTDDAFVVGSTLQVGSLPSVGGTAVYADGSGSIGFDTSSRRYKTNISYTDNADWIYKLRPVTFDYIESGEESIGLIAEEADSVSAPFVVRYDSAGAPEGVHYEKLIVPMLVELQQMRAEVDSLKGLLK